MTTKAFIRADRIDRPYLIGVDFSKDTWRTVYISHLGMVRIYADKPWQTQDGRDMPGRVTYETIHAGKDFYFTEPRYRTGKGAAIIAGRFLKCVVDVMKNDSCLPAINDRLRAKWSMVYGQRLEE